MHIHLDGVRAELAKLGRFMALSEEHLAAILSAHDQVDPARQALVDGIAAATKRVGELEAQLKDWPGFKLAADRTAKAFADARQSLEKAAADRDAAKAALAAAQSTAAKAAAVADETIATLRAHIAAIEAGAAAGKPIPAAPAAAPAAADPDVTPALGQVVGAQQPEQQVKSDT